MLLLRALWDVLYCGRECTCRKPTNLIDLTVRTELMQRLAGNSLIAVAIGLLACCMNGQTRAQSPTPQELPSSSLDKASNIWIAEPGDTSLNRWDPRQLFEDSGVVLEWDSQKTVLVRASATNKTTIPGDFVVRIEPVWANAAGERIHRWFSERQYQSVVKNGKEAINSGLPRWQQRVILAEMIESYSAMGKPNLAGILFVSLAKEDCPQLLLATIPLPWGEMSFADADLSRIQSLSEDWMVQETEAVQLLGAAWLISGAKRSIAIETLERLMKNSKNPMVGAYARAQLWRTVPPAEILSERLPRWLAERDKLLLPLQAGPTMLLAERLQQAGLSNLAIPEWLRIATLHGDRYHLASKAISKASAGLRAAGRIEEADRVQSLLDRFKTENQSPK